MFFWPFFNLRVIDGKLYGTAPFSTSREIRPEDVVDAREYSFNNPFLGVATSKRCYKVGLFSKHYLDVLDFVETRTAFRPSRSSAYKANRGWYWPVLLPLHGRSHREAGVDNAGRPSAPADSQYDIARLWRIFLCTVLLAGLGTLAGPYWFQHPDGWSPGAWACVPFGLFIGMFWHMWQPCRRRATPHKTMLVLSLAVIGMSAGFYSPAATKLRVEKQQLAILKTLLPGSLQTIRVYDRRGDKEIADIRDRGALLEFVSLCRDVSIYSPSHDSAAEEWYLILVGVGLELQCYRKANSRTAVFGHFVVKTGTHTTYYGAFTASSLGPWFDAYVVPPWGK